MQTVCETKAFQKTAGDAGMVGDEVEAFIEFIALNPLAGDEIEGTGGCRKVRVAGKGKGKSGGYRVVTFFTGPNLPIFLITVFAKGTKVSLTKAEKNQMAQVTKKIVAEYKKRVVSVEKAKEAGL